MVQASLSDQQTTAQITQKALANRSLFQASWKSLLGFLAVLFGALTASIQALSLPPAVSAALAAGGLAILAFERIADAIDYRTLVTGGSPATDQGRAPCSRQLFGTVGRSSGSSRPRWVS